MLAKYKRRKHLRKFIKKQKGLHIIQNETTAH